MKFVHIVSVVKSYWPLEFMWEGKSKLVFMEELISEKMIGMEDELLYRELSYSLMLYFWEMPQPSLRVKINEVNWDDVKTIFEQRIGTWNIDNDVFTSDMKSRNDHYKDND
ncbi:hypothetical protein [Vibrio scophthalmi]|uniref:Uncharacterized protein n=1 Tax=Vibrio scophthalmi LMG 19158 TaxID=870967 RepID=F9RS96_9VIBR|nr:hypothetical protein [Vibrio scophthalmi]EGU32422.1 hypothetical protein VIS19158_06385 [Vibrio scophthalmi LMG 19158]